MLSVFTILRSKPEKICFTTQRCLPGRQQSLAGPCLLPRHTDLAQCLCTMHKQQSDNPLARDPLRTRYLPTGTVKVSTCRGALGSFQLVSNQRPSIHLLAVSLKSKC